MTASRTVRAIWALLAAVAMCATIVLPANTADAADEPNITEFGTNYPSPAPDGSGLSAQAAVVGDWTVNSEFAAAAGGLEQSPKDGSILYTQYRLSNSIPSPEDIVGSIDINNQAVANYPFGSTGSGPAQFGEPLDVAVDVNDQIYVADSFNDRIQVFDVGTGEPTYKREFNGSLAIAGVLDCPTAVEYYVAIPQDPPVFDAFDNSVFILTGDDTVRVMNPFGDVLRAEWGDAGSDDGEFDNGCNPAGLAVDRTNKQVLVSDCGNMRVSRFEFDGTFVDNIGVGMLGCARGVDVDLNGYIYVVDETNDVVVVFDNAGAFSETIGNPGNSLGEFQDPIGIDVNEEGTRLWVADRGNNRIQTFWGTGYKTCGGLDVTLAGTNWDDDLVGTTDADVVWLGTGEDSFVGNGGGDTVCTDLVEDEGNKTITTTEGDDTITLGDGDDIVRTGDGDDTVDAGEGDNTVDGEDGNDMLTASDGDDNLKGGAGNDTLVAGNGTNTLNGDAGNDTMTGGDGVDTMTGGSGKDVMTGAAGNDTLSGNSGDDTIDGGAGNDLIDGGANDDIITGGDGSDTIDGGTGDDEITGDAGNDTIIGNDGNDIIIAGDGDDDVAGGAGNDIIQGNAGEDEIDGEGGDDIITGGDDDDTIDGGTGDDIIFAQVGNDTVTDPAGENTLSGGDGDDMITGGTGKDLIAGGAGDDTLAGGLSVDKIFAQDGNDTIDGGGGSDKLYGMVGNDTINAGSGADKVYGGDGNDIINGQGGQDTIWGEAGDDVIQGNWQSDVMRGGDGDDIIRGSRGKDKLYGEAGDDKLFGGDNTDFLDGGPGDDLADGQKGSENVFVADVSGCVNAETEVSC